MTSFDQVVVAPSGRFDGISRPYDAAEVLRFYRDIVRDAPDELGTVVRFGTAPPLPVIPPHLHWRPVVIVASFSRGIR